MPVRSLQLVLVNTPIGALGSGRGGGVELTLASLIQGLVRQNHRVTLVSAKGSTLPSGCTGVTLVEVEGVDDGGNKILVVSNVLMTVFHISVRIPNESPADD